MNQLEISQQFAELDSDKDGTLSAEEIERFFNSYGVRVTVEEVKNMIEKADDNNDGLITIKEFQTLLEYYPIVGVLKTLKEVFDSIDKKEKGLITKAQLGEFLISNGFRCSVSELKVIIDQADLDNNDAIDFHEFSKIAHF